ncbi:hypothetical protein EYX56_04920 [Escherichia coli]|nr:hypothetical protein [Escherichia coli]
MKNALTLNKPSMAEYDQFTASVEAVMKYLADNHHPHTKIIIDSDSAELVEGIATHRTDKFIKD